MRKSTNSEPLKARLAAWLATGGSVASFARGNPPTSERTFQRWASSPEVQAEVARLSAEMVQAIIRRLTAVSVLSTEELRRLLGDADPGIRLGAVRTALRTLIPLAKFADLDRRIAELEEATRGEF